MKYFVLIVILFFWAAIAFAIYSNHHGPQYHYVCPKGYVMEEYASQYGCVLGATRVQK